MSLIKRWRRLATERIEAGEHVIQSPSDRVHVRTEASCLRRCTVSSSDVVVVVASSTLFAKFKHPCLVHIADADKSSLSSLVLSASAM